MILPQIIWTTLLPLSTARYGFGISGNWGENIRDWCSRTSYLASAEVFNPTTNTWTSLSSMSTARRFFQTEVIAGKINSIGGQTASGALHW
jgi:hypothetical protein